MVLNHKLTKVIRGRTITAASSEGGALNIAFDDGSRMRVKLGSDCDGESLTGHMLKEVRQQDAAMEIDFADGTSATLALAEATSSVILRDKTNVLEYVD